MSRIIAAVPNVCEGRDQGWVDALAAQLEAVPELMMLDVAVDRARNRTVLCFTGGKEALFAGGFVLYEETLRHVDMRRHEGAYPRIGAVDVFPFVPLKDATIEEAVAMSVEFGERVAERFRLPVYLFSESARYQARRDIDNIREGEYEGFAEKMRHPRWKPDFGPDELPPDSGATIIGARHPLISFRALLSIGDLAAAEAIAHLLADPAAGLRHVKAHAAIDPESSLAMLTVNIGNFQASPMYRVVETLRLEARRFGTGLRRLEMIGLVPESAWFDAAEAYLGVQGFRRENLLERNLMAHVTERYLLKEG